ncbi:MAG: IPT/TIG domain-containing protein [Armatimonadetes bacterium]|nr:IPT/TIG domain-containing protein [Armatimonadota bacterium]
MRGYFFFLCLLLSLIFSGCGGGGGSAGSGVSQSPGIPPGPGGSGESSGTGRIELQVQWPEASLSGKLIPQAAQRIEVAVSGEGLPQPLVQSVLRSQIPQGNQVSMTFAAVPVGSKRVEVFAFDSSGNTVAHRIVPITVRLAQTEQVPASLGLSILDGSYKPGSFSLLRDEVLLWVNGGSQNHTVTSDNGLFDSGPLAPGQQFTWQATTPGTFGFHCSLHPSETGTLAITFPVPELLSVTPPFGVAAFSGAVPGSSFTISGANFGAFRSGSTVTIGTGANGMNAIVNSWSDSQIVCSVPQGAATGDIRVQVNGQTSNTTAFPVASPLAIDQGFPVGIVVSGSEVFWIENRTGPPDGQIRKVSVNGGTPTPMETLVAGPVPFNYGLAPGRGLAVNTRPNPDLVWLDTNNVGTRYRVRTMKTNDAYGSAATVTLYPKDSPLRISSGWIAADNNAAYSAICDDAGKVPLRKVTFAGTSTFCETTSTITLPGSGVSMDGQFALISVFIGGAGDAIFRADTTTSVFDNVASNNPFLFPLSVDAPMKVVHVVADKSYIFWVEKEDSSGAASSGKIRRALKDGSGTTTLVTGLPNPTRIVLNRGPGDLLDAGRLFWLDDNGLHTLTLADSLVKDLWKPPAGATGGDLFYVQGLPAAVYWTEKSATGRIYKMLQ